MPEDVLARALLPHARFLCKPRGRYSRTKVWQRTAIDTRLDAVTQDIRRCREKQGRWLRLAQFKKEQGHFSERKVRLALRAGPLTLREVAELLSFSRTGAWKVLKRLEDQGYVVCRSGRWWATAVGNSQGLTDTPKAVNHPGSSDTPYSTCDPSEMPLAAKQGTGPGSETGAQDVNHLGSGPAERGTGTGPRDAYLPGLTGDRLGATVVAQPDVREGEAGESWRHEDAPVTEDDVVHALSAGGVNGARALVRSFLAADERRTLYDLLSVAQNVVWDYVDGELRSPQAILVYRLKRDLQPAVDLDDAWDGQMVRETLEDITRLRLSAEELGQVYEQQRLASSNVG